VNTVFSSVWQQCYDKTTKLHCAQNKEPGRSFYPMSESTANSSFVCV